MNRNILPLLFAALALSVCKPPQATDNINLCNYLPPHSEAARLDGADIPRYNAADARISAATAHGDDSKRKYCGQTWRSAADDAAMQSAIGAALGQDWYYRETLQEGDLNIALWETRSDFWPKKHYALTTAPAAGDAPRLMRSTYIENNSSDLNGSVVFGIIVSPFLIVLAIIAPLIWRKRRRARKG